MTVIFNSLGSNYSKSDARILRTIRGNSESRTRLKEAIKNYFADQPSRVELFYKAREALVVGLKMLDLPAGSEVGVTGFTCYVVEQSIKRAGLVPVFLDVEKEQLNFGIKSIEKAVKKGAHLRVIIIQNTFGYQMEELVEVLQWAKENEVVVIEDAAHGLGLQYQIPNGTFCGPLGIDCGRNGAKMGLFGDLSILSFSQDKMLDVVSGGALIVNNEEKVNWDMEKIQNEEKWTEIDKKQKEKDRKYAIYAVRIRNWYSSGWGKWLHHRLKKKNKLSNPMTYRGDEAGVHQIFKWQAARATDLLREGELEKNLAWRRNVALSYWQNIDQEWRVPGIGPAAIEYGACLRWPILVPEEKRAGLIKYLARRKIYLSDVWYETVVAPKRCLEKSEYRVGECPQSEKLGGQIFNLPTHKQVATKMSKKIAQYVNNYLKDSK